jgi:hypothetical protein
VDLVQCQGMEVAKFESVTHIVQVPICQSQDIW